MYLTSSMYLAPFGRTLKTSHAKTRRRKKLLKTKHGHSLESPCAFAPLRDKKGNSYTIQLSVFQIIPIPFNTESITAAAMTEPIWPPALAPMACMSR